MKKIVLQVGHENTKFNVDPQLRPMTGAPQEETHNETIVNRTSELLRQRGFEVIQTDANANSDPAIITTPTVTHDFDLFLAVHCDSDNPNTNGGFTDYAEPNLDLATVESQRIANAIADKFFPETGIARHDERRGNINVRQYYMWAELSAKTPCVLIEMGESVDPHDVVILNDFERCAIALARGVCNAFGVAYDFPTPPPPPQPPIPPTPQPVPEPPVPTQPDYKKALLDIKPIATKFHWFYQGDFKKIAEIIKKVEL